MDLIAGEQYRVTRDNNRYSGGSPRFGRGEIVTLIDAEIDGDGEVAIEGFSRSHDCEVTSWIFPDALEPESPKTEGVDDIDIDMALKSVGLNKYTPLNFAGWNVIRDLAEKIKEARNAL